MALVDKHWGPFGMKSWTIVQFEEGDPSGMHVQAIMLWESIEAFEKAIVSKTFRFKSEARSRWSTHDAESSCLIPLAVACPKSKTC